MSKEERDLRMAELNKLIDELEKSVGCYCPRNRDFAFAQPLPKIMRLVLTELMEIRLEIEALKSFSCEKILKDSASID
jgi:hypothetical protein